MQQGDNAFFATQIAQQTAEQPREGSAIESPQAAEDSATDKQEDDPHSLRHLLTAFNSHDREEKGLIKLSAVEQILSSKAIPTKNIKQYHEMSLPMYEQLASFDEFLFIYCLSQNTSEFVQQKYALCQKVDPRLISFLKLLNNYRKKSERSGRYNEAKNSKKKIEEIRERELQRRNKYLKILYENQVNTTEEKQKSKFEDFCKKWDQFMNDYEATASDLVLKVKDKQQAEIKEYEDCTREELAAKMHFSKYLLELQLKEKNLVKLQQYEKAGQVQVQIEQVKSKQLRDKEVSDQQKVELRLRSFRKTQEATISSLLQKIQKDRNDHIKQRQIETEKLMVRNKSQLTDIDHRFNETAKRVYEALHNLGLENQKNK